MLYRNTDSCTTMAVQNFNGRRGHSGIIADNGWEDPSDINLNKFIIEEVKTFNLVKKAGIRNRALICSQIVLSWSDHSIFRPTPDSFTLPTICQTGANLMAPAVPRDRTWIFQSQNQKSDLKIQIYFFCKFAKVWHHSYPYTIFDGVFYTAGGGGLTSFDVLCILQPVLDHGIHSFISFIFISFIFISDWFYMTVVWINSRIMIGDFMTHLMVMMILEWIFFPWSPPPPRPELPPKWTLLIN